MCLVYVSYVCYDVCHTVGVFLSFLCGSLCIVWRDSVAVDVVVCVNVSLVVAQNIFSKTTDP